MNDGIYKIRFWINQTTISTVTLEGNFFIILDKFVERDYNIIEIESIEIK